MAERRPTKGRVLLDVRVPWRWIAGVLVALSVLLVAAVVGFSAVNRIETCDVCHIIKDEVTTYKQSAHYAAGVGCQQCHTKPGVFNYLVRNLQGTTNLILYASNQYERPLTTFVGSQNCLQCHPNEEIETDQVVGNIRVNHTGLREAGYQCLTCHANISHPGTQLEVARVPQSKMSICARCHDGETLPDDCDICHVRGLPASAPKVAMDVRIEPDQCRECHQRRTYCRACHQGLEMPHPDRWNRLHGPVVLDRGKRICVSCHLQDDPTFCLDCHGVAIPHPGGWERRHGAVGRSDPQVCVKCHGRNSCTTCHGLQMPHPSGWTQTHPSTARSSPAVCGRCHSSAFCTACHGVSLPHSGSFIANHWDYTANNGAACVKCHGNDGSTPEGCFGGECHSGTIDP